MASGKDYVNQLALELDVMEGEGRKVYLPDSGLEELGSTGFKDRFSNILTGFALEEPNPADRHYLFLQTLDEEQEEKDKRVAEKEEVRQKWWEAVQETVREDADLFQKVRRSRTHLHVLLSLPPSQN